MPLKRDAEAIRAHMLGLASELRLDGNRKLWPHWLFRSDYIENAAAILNSGKLLSRSAAERNKLIVKDSGSPRHIGQLSREHRGYVRLYFRPRTPTQYRNEGIRPTTKIELDAHMPVPVYLLFSSTLLMEAEVAFTRGRLTAGTEIGNSVEFLRRINFADVYHDRGVGAVGGSDRRSDILNARHSEVIVKNDSNLEYVRHVICRSASERETLLNLLSPEARKRWAQRIHVDEGRRILFYKRGTFVQSADLSETGSRFVFYANGDPDMRGPFHLHIEWIGRGDKRNYADRNFTVATEPLELVLPQPEPQYEVRITMNGDLAYLGRFDDAVASKAVF